MAAAATRAARLRTAWRDLKSQRKVRQRDAAELLGVSEAERLASAVGDGGRVLAEGTPEAVLTPDALETCLGIEAMVPPHPRSNRPLIVVNA